MLSSTYCYAFLIPKCIFNIHPCLSLRYKIHTVASGNNKLSFMQFVIFEDTEIIFRLNSIRHVTSLENRYQVFFSKLTHSTTVNEISNLIVCNANPISKLLTRTYKHLSIMTININFSVLRFRRNK